MEDFFGIAVPLGVLFIGLPWLILHYITKWKQSPSLTNEDERLLDDMHLTARRLEERLQTIERIIAADHPDFRPADRDLPTRDYRDNDFNRRL
ncbi:phage shock protein B [Sphingomonas sp. Leaf24]|uniref:envelope stress response membrane protein PspB n=1 Tax=unclassified Sphingomonas TaxID=196159 RepID=UPI0006F7BD6C|nr:MULTISPECIES: envelope stress response membrane protein PspB [unclassified Sphingomonas]KQM18047.1 phage shock protein B [Sphingomonas sp. Leaf5]KQM89028.1 phage shock protein B [Sphingomonas sp. Leaf24]KQN71959.1 phage shock protein B [Sphingomonas sp. Leaf62]KQN91468.1 phage shock protein B [Sphingomonas sp. Leaf67]